MSEFNCEKYPIASLKPKQETNVLSFLAKYPNFSGDGVTIAILDSGVDPNAAGLQVSPLVHSLRADFAIPSLPDASKWSTKSC